MPPSHKSAENVFSRMRRAESGHHHHVAGPYLLQFAQEAAWREDHRREPNGLRTDRIEAMAMHTSLPSILRILAAQPAR
jgi:hypothetical protein